MRILRTLGGSVRCFRTLPTRLFLTVETLVVIRISVRGLDDGLFGGDGALAR